MPTIIKLQEWPKLVDFIDDLAKRGEAEVTENTAILLVQLATQVITEANSQGVGSWVRPKVKNNLYYQLSRSRNQRNAPVKFSKKAEEKIIDFIRNN